MTSEAAPPRRDSAGVNDQNPWPGLDAFAEGDCEYFRGRGDETAELFRLVIRETLTVLYGPSGLGKTSLLQAGLFPELRKADFLPLYVRLDHSDEAPRLADQVRGTIAAAIDSKDAEAIRPDDNETLSEYFHRRDVEFWNPKNRLLTPVLVFDQFEEIFTVGRENETRRVRCTAFLTELANLIEKRPPAALKKKWEVDEDDATRFDFERESFKVVLSLREDYLHGLAGLRPLIRSVGVVRNWFCIPPMNGQKAFDVVTGPGANIVDGDVAAQIVQLVAGSRAPAAAVAHGEMLNLEVDPALLSLFCSQLNKRRLSLHQPKITADLLAGSHQEILNTFYNESLADLPVEVRVFIEKRLLTRSGYRNSVALEDALGEKGITPEIIDRFVKRRLLRREDRGLGVVRIELTHDVLTGVIRASRDAREKKAAEDALAAQRAEGERERQLAAAQLAAERGRTAREKRKTLWAVAASLLAAIFAAVGWLGFIEAKKATRHAEDLGQQANDARARADGVIQFMLYDLRDKLQPVGQLQLASDVNAKVLDYYGQLKDADETETVRWGKAVALQTSGDIQAEAGRLTKALEAHSESLEIVRALLEGAPTDADTTQFVSTQCGRVAMTKWRQGDLRAAVVLLDKGLKAAQQAAAGNDPQPLAIRNLAAWRVSFADAIKAQGRFDEALTHYRESLRERRILADLKDATAYDKANLRSSYIDLGDALRSLGDLSGALKYFQDSLTLARELKEANPSDVYRLHDLSQSYDRVGEALQASGKLGEAIDAFAESHALFERLKEHDPNNANWQRNYSVTQLRLLEVIETCGSRPEARNWFANALWIRRDLARIDETDADAQDDLSDAHARVGGHLLAHGDLKGALDHCQKALELCSKTAAKDSTNLDRQEMLADAHDILGAVWRARGEFEPALVNCNKSLDIRQKLAQVDARNAIRQANLATSQEHLADTFREQGNTVAARPPYERALEIRHALAAKDNTNAQWQDDLAAVCCKLGLISAAEKKFAEASKHFQGSREILDKLVKLDPRNANWQDNFADATIASAEVVREQGDNERAGGLLRAGLKAREHLATLDDANTQRQAEYARALYLTSITIASTEPKSAIEAQQMLTQARELMLHLKDKAELTSEQQQWLAEINQGG